MFLCEGNQLHYTHEVTGNFLPGFKQILIWEMIRHRELQLHTSVPLAGQSSDTLSVSLFPPCPSHSQEIHEVLNVQENKSKGETIDKRLTRAIDWTSMGAHILQALKAPFVQHFEKNHRQ